MQIGIVCKVIDNYGDAGFSLRLARALARLHHTVTLFHDNAATFKAIYPTPNTRLLTLVDASNASTLTNSAESFDLLLEPFGSSSEHTAVRFDVELKRNHPDTPWLLIDYLSSEAWVEDFHLNSSIDPQTGHKTCYFYPGFTNKTGGLIHCDYPLALRQQSGLAIKAEELKLFVFAYPNAPVIDLLIACDAANAQGASIEVGLSKWMGFKERYMEEFKCAKPLAFCPQSEFDDLLASHDVLFVRGEDSFVRAQLAGKPFVWQIYATDDDAHATKLASFFDLYSQGLSRACAEALWNCWSSWNRFAYCPGFAKSWAALNSHWEELQAHAIRWQSKLFSGPELVKEVLTWRNGQTPTLIEKPDL